MKRITVAVALALVVSPVSLADSVCSRLVETGGLNAADSRCGDVVSTESPHDGEGGSIDGQANWALDGTFKLADVDALRYASPSDEMTSSHETDADLAGHDLGKPQPLIDKDEALIRAFNTLSENDEGLRLDQFSHQVDFFPGGIRLRPRGGDPSWSWRLVAIGTDGDQSLQWNGWAAPRQEGMSIVYDRGDIIEQYVVRTATVEQQFVIPAPLDLRGGDLVIEGSVASAGRFHARDGHWQWSLENGAVNLGEVVAYDATGAVLPSVFSVAAGSTRIEVDGAALAHASYPVVIDPEIGFNDSRISDLGPDGFPDYLARHAAVAYNSLFNQYLVVWEGNDGDPVPGVFACTLEEDADFEIYGQRLDGSSGAQIGSNDFLISGIDDPNACDPAIAYNENIDEYLVVWAANNEIYGQRLQGNGTLIGTPDFAVSSTGSAKAPDVVYNAIEGAYLVVWYDNLFFLNENEIFGQRLDSFGNQIGTNDFRISDMGPEDDGNYGAFDPAVAVLGSLFTRYLVVWEGDDDTGSLVDSEFEIFGQRLDASGSAVGSNDFRISDMGSDGNDNNDALNPAVTCGGGFCLVVWQGDDGDADVEIYGQRLNEFGNEVGTNDFRISDMGPGGALHEARYPAVAYDSTAGEYLVVWEGDDDTGNLENDEKEIFVQRLSGTGDEIGPNDFRISDMGPDQMFAYEAERPAVAYSATSDEFLIVWEADDDQGGIVDDEVEIHQQRYTTSGLGAYVTGVRPAVVQCRNLDTGDVRGSSFSGQRSWSCESLGLPFSSGDRILQLVRAPATSPTVTGFVSGMTPTLALCRNQTTGNQVIIPLGGVTSWDCEAAGLVIVEGDGMLQGVLGTAN